jgi:hypothetical protein
MGRNLKTAMLTWGGVVFIALALVVAGALYIRLRWQRSPQAYRAMTVQNQTHLQRVGQTSKASGLGRSARSR